MAVSVAELDARLRRRRRRRRSSVDFKAGRAAGEHGGSRPCVRENPALLSSGFKAGLIDPNAVLPGPAQMVQLLAAATRDLKPILIE
jgi:hypothetical protein